MADSKFKLVSNYSPQGDQGKAISQLTEGLKNNLKFQSLLGVTGSGKTYSIANVIENIQIPALVLAPNKTLAAQLCNEFKEFFPDNAVEFFVSYYDYYQPEAYLPGKDMYIEKDTSINEEIEKLRLSTTNSLYTRNDVIVVASVSCIYGLGSPSEYGKQRIILISGEIFNDQEVYIISPATHFLATAEWVDRALVTIEEELSERIKYFKDTDKLLEAQRLESRTRYDMEMIAELGFCGGIENYSRHILGKKPGEAPNTLLDFFPEDFLVVIDESHISVPQIRGMYEGDHSRKQTLVDHGFRLPSAMDNRPLRFEEFEAKIKRVIFTSATPGPYERRVSNQIVEQIIRPTGLVDPQVYIRKTKGQIDDLMDEIKKVVSRGERALVTTLTKRMAEDLAEYLASKKIKVRYLHSTIDTLERVEILRYLRTGECDVLVGINLLREGLDLPEVSLVAILDADKEGFLRSEISLIQTIGRAARNVNGKVIMYADDITDSIKNALYEKNRRRNLQIEYNKKHNITPKTINKTISDILYSRGIKTKKETISDHKVSEKKKLFGEDKLLDMEPSRVATILIGLEEEMNLEARELNFEN